MGHNYDIMPVVGIYIDYLNPPPEQKFRSLLYPVPLQGANFLGSHWCLDINGNLKLGPNFTPVLWREQYSFLENINFMDMAINIKNYIKIMLSEKR